MTIRGVDQSRRRKFPLASPNFCFLCEEDFPLPRNNWNILAIFSVFHYPKKVIRISWLCQINAKFTRIKLLFSLNYCPCSFCLFGWAQWNRPTKIGSKARGIPKWAACEQFSCIPFYLPLIFLEKCFYKRLQWWRGIMGELWEGRWGQGIRNIH